MSQGFTTPLPIPLPVNKGGTGTTTSTGTGSVVLSTSPTIANPRIGNIFDSANSLNALTILGVASAVNAVYVQSSATGNPVGIGPIGSDSNIELLLTGKGTSGVPIRGVSTNSNASAGYVGEIISGTAVSTAVSLTTSIASDVTSISLTAGDWDVNGVVNFAPGGATTVSQITSAINTVSATIPDTFGTPSINNSRSALAMTFTTAAPQVLSVMPCRISIAATTTVYLIARSNFGASTMTVGGIIWARRVR